MGVILRKLLLLSVIGSCLILNGCDKSKTEVVQEEVEQPSLGEMERQNEIELLNEISGVWTDNRSLITLNYNGGDFQLLVDEKPIFVNIGDIDLDNNTVNLLAYKTSDGKQVIWTFKKVLDDDSSGFTLRLTFHDGSSQSLGFVRKISNDDKQRITNIYLEDQNSGNTNLKEFAYADDANLSQDDTKSYSSQDFSQNDQENGTVSSNCESDKFNTYQRRFKVYSQDQGLMESSPEYKQAIKLAKISIQQSCAKESEAEIVGKPSFNCQKAKGYVEETICSTVKLGALDTKAAHAYSSAKFFAMDKDQFYKAASDWRKRRGKCTTEECIEQVYLDRIQYLNTQY